MLRHLFTVAVGLTVSACVVQSPPGYWARPGSPYGQGYYPYPYAQGWNTPAAPRGAYTPPAQASYAPQPASYVSQPGSFSAQPASYVSQPASWPPQSDTYPSQSGNDSPSEPHSARTTFADETADYGIPPTNTLHLHDFDAPTPTHIEGAQIVSTVELRRMMTSEKPPLLIDVIGRQQSVSLPNATWLRDAGVGRHLDDDVQAWFDLHLSKLTDHDKSRPLVFFCASRMCWLAHNATLRALDLGYTNVYWYRGGRDSWQAAGLPMSPVAPPPIDD